MDKEEFKLYVYLLLRLVLVLHIIERVRDLGIGTYTIHTYNFVELAPYPMSKLMLAHTECTYSIQFTCQAD